MSHRPRTAPCLFSGRRSVCGCRSVASPAIAAERRPGMTALQSSVRLIAARTKGEGAERIYRAGIEIKLSPGWKTYWRYPGDSGVPPRFDFSKSDNVKTVDGAVPGAASGSPTAPAGTRSATKHGVVLPVHVVPQRCRQSRSCCGSKLDYAVCEKLCVPAEANLELKLTGAEQASDATVGAAEALVPKSAAIGGDGAFAIRAVQPRGRIASPRSLSTWLHPRASTLDAVRRRARPRNGRCRCRSRSPARPRASSALRSSLDGLPPGESGKGATLAADRGRRRQGDRGRIPSRLIRRRR